MTKIFLQVPFNQKDEAKKAGAKWDTEEKEWYCEGDITPELKKWTKCDVAVAPHDKENLKALFPSIKWNKKLYKWECSLEDYNKLS